MSNKRSGPMPKGHHEKVNDRCDGMCEGCHVRPANDLHHRLTLRRGGMHNLANLVALCGRGNHDNGVWCHGLAHANKGGEGWLISMHEKKPPAEIPFVDRDGTAWRFDDSGGKERI